MHSAVGALAVLALIAGVSTASAAPSARPPVSAEEEQEFISAVERRSADDLIGLFAHRISLVQGVGQFELESAQHFLREMDGCTKHRVTRFGNDPELFVEWICPDRPWRQQGFEAEGYITTVWHHPAGLTLVYYPSGITVRLPGPPSTPIRR